MTEPGGTGVYHAQAMSENILQEAGDGPDTGIQPGADVANEGFEGTEPEVAAESEETVGNEPESAAGDEGAAGGEPETVRKNGVQKRIEQLTREKYEARARAELLERQNRELLEQAQRAIAPKPEAAKPEPALKRPNIDDFDSDAEFYDALADYSRRLAIRDIKAEQEAQRAAAENQQRLSADQKAQQEIGRKVQELVISSASAHPELMDNLQNPNLPLTRETLEAALEVENSADVLAYISGDLTVARQLASASPAMQGVLVAKMASTLAAGKSSPRKNITNAPAPTTPTGATRKTPEKDINKMSQAEYEAYRAAGGGRRS